MKTKTLIWILLFLLTISKGYAQNKELEIPTSPKGKKELIIKRKNYTFLSMRKRICPIGWLGDWIRRSWPNE